MTTATDTTPETPAPEPRVLFAHCASPHVDPEPATHVHVVQVQAATPTHNAYQAIPYCDLCARHTVHKALRVWTPEQARSMGWQVTERTR